MLPNELASRLAPPTSTPSISGCAIKLRTCLSKDGGAPLSIAGMMGFVGQVEFADGKVWIPNRESLANAQLLGILEPSPERATLDGSVPQKGPRALADELSKF